MVARSKFLCACALVLLICSVVPSADKAQNGNAEIVKKALAALSAAYNARDAKAIGELLTPGGEFIDGDGDVFEGREAIVKEFAALFENRPKDAVELTAQDIREISPGILSVECTANYPAGDDSEATDVELATLLVKQSDGRWLFASIRSEEETSVRTPHAYLKRLEWLIGEWVDESGESTMHIKTRWSDDGNFIVSDFTIRVAGRKVLSGTQRIGWDGSLDKFKSWVFDSEGGYAEGIWTENDDRWIVKSTGVRPEGDACSATQTYDQDGPDAYVFSATDRIVGDDFEPDFIAEVVRKPPEPDQGASTAGLSRGK
jgi:uncharacterized protein (TIGR02246 family)